jgi:hypothetical protein
MLSMKVVMAHLVRNFEFSTDLKFEEIELHLPVILKFKHGYNLSIKKRTSRKAL